MGHTPPTLGKALSGSERGRGGFTHHTGDSGHRKRQRCLTPSSLTEPHCAPLRTGTEESLFPRLHGLPSPRPWPVRKAQGLASSQVRGTEPEGCKSTGHTPFLPPRVLLHNMQTCSMAPPQGGQARPRHGGLQPAASSKPADPWALPRDAGVLPKSAHWPLFPGPPMRL